MAAPRKGQCPPGLPAGAGDDDRNAVYLTLDGTDHRSHEEQKSTIRRLVTW